MKKWFNKQTITVFILTALISSSFGVFAESRTISAYFNDIRLRVNGVFIKTDVEPCIVNGRTLVPARFIAEALGASVSFNETENYVDVVSKPEPKPEPEPTTKPETTPEPTPEPAPTTPPKNQTTTPLADEPAPVDNSAAYDAELASLTATYNMDISNMTTATQNTCSQLTDTLYAKYPNSQYRNGRQWDLEYKVLQENIASQYAALGNSKSLREAVYNAAVSSLKVKYGK